MKIDFQFDDERAEVIRELNKQSADTLERIAKKGAKYAKENLKAANRVDTGALINSIESTVSEGAAIIGTNNSYAPHHELGTGRYTTPHANEPYGVSAVHFLRYAFSKHLGEYAKMLENGLKG